jgi:tripartite-type tricarboxylate transporter receptor subunit TctC
MPRPVSRLIRNSLCALTLLCAASVAEAETFPSRPITIMVGYTPGGQADAIARAVAKGLSENLKTPVIVENKPGANGLISAQSVAKADPDGHTLVLVTDAMTTIDPQLNGPVKFDPSATLRPIVNMVKAPLFVAANNDLPANSLGELIELGRKDPDSLSFGTSGSATPHRMVGELLKQLGGFEMMHVSYKGTSAAVTNLAGGQIPLVIGGAGSLLPLVEAGRIKLLAVSSAQRFPPTPDVPAISETFKGFDMVVYMGLMAPKATPDAVIETLNREVNKVLTGPDVKAILDPQGMITVGGTPEDFKAQIEADYQARGKIIRDLDIKAE